MFLFLVLSSDMASGPWKVLSEARIQMGATAARAISRTPPVPGEWFLGSFSRAKGEFPASGFPLLRQVGSL